MDARSEAILAHVHPDLCKVMRAAAQTPQPFVIVCGLRTPQAQEQAVATGHSWTLKSRHLPNLNYPGPEDPNGLSCAVDVVALIRGVADYAKGHEAEVFGQIAQQVAEAARAVGIVPWLDDSPENRPNVGLQWGGAAVGAWTLGVPNHEPDWGHYQLTHHLYPDYSPPAAAAAAIAA